MRTNAKEIRAMRGRRKRLEDGIQDLGSPDMNDLTAVTLPEAVPQNPDGTPRTDGTVSTDQAQKIGALDLESAQKNTRMARVMTAKALGEQNVPWNSDDALEQVGYQRVVSGGEWNSMVILVSRSEPGPVAHLPPVSGSVIKSAADLYAYVEKYHGTGQATYKVRFQTATGAQRGASHFSIDKAYAQPPAPIPGPTPSPPIPLPLPPQPSEYGRPVVVNVPAQAAPPSAPEARSDGMVLELFGHMQTQMREMQAGFAGMMKEVVAELRRPAGFIPLPEGYPIPVGYVGIPGGCIPAPPTAMAAPAPVYVPVPAAAPPSVPVQPATTAAPAPLPPPVSPVAQVTDAFKMMSELHRGMQHFKNIFATEEAPPMAEEVAEAAAGRPPGPQTTDVAGVPVTYDVDGKVNWPLTLVGAAPKAVELAKGVLTEYGRVVEKQSAANQQAVHSRIELARAISGQPAAPAPAPVLSSAPVAPTPTPPPLPTPPPVSPPRPAAAPYPTTILAPWDV
jgi:hypothetical protein